MAGTEGAPNGQPGTFYVRKLYVTPTVCLRMDLVTRAKAPYLRRPPLFAVHLLSAADPIQLIGRPFANSGIALAKCV